MRCTYLLAVVVLVVCLTTFAQSPKEKVSPVSAEPAVIATAPTDAKTPYASTDTDKDRPQTGRDDLPSQFTPLALNSDHGIVISPDALGGGTCYAIRSYVMARDRKDSDSTHLVHTSTCQPSNRYRVRNAELKLDTPNH